MQYLNSLMKLGVHQRLKVIFKGNNSCSSDDILTKLYVHSGVILIHNLLKFHGVLMIGYLVIVNSIEFKSIKGLLPMQYLKSLIRLDVYQRLIVIYIYFKFHEIRGY